MSWGWMEELPDAALALAPSGRIEAISPLAKRMLGLDEDAPPADADALLALPDELRGWLVSPTDPERLALRVGARHSDGTPLTFELSARRRAGGATCLLREPETPRPDADVHRCFEGAFDAAPIGMALLDTDGRYTRVNRALCEMLGRSPEQLRGRRDGELTHPDDRDADLEAAWQILGGEIDAWQREKRFLRADGSPVWAIANVTLLRDEHGRPACWVGQFQDITDRKRRERALREQAERDPLTGVLNRRSFDRALERMIGDGRAGVALLIELESFAAVNDYFGHHAGDLALLAITELLRSELRACDRLGRVGGVAFAALLPGLNGEQAAPLVERIARRISELRYDFDPRAAVGASVGIGIIEPSAKPTLDRVLREADLAMYRVGIGAGAGETVWRRSDPSPAQPAELSAVDALGA